MSKTNQTRSIEFLALHAITNLPDSTIDRKRTLDAIIAALPRNNETRIAAQTLVLSMQQQDKLQAQLKLAFEQMNTGGKP